MRELILASNNAKKIKELKAIVEKLGWNVKSLADNNIDIEVEEDGLTFEANAEKKAREIYDFLIKRGDKGFAVLADDSGLEVDAIGKKPGIYSSRYAGENATDAQNREKLLKALKNTPASHRTGRFVCCIAVVFPDGKEFVVRGTCEGSIAFEEKGNNGFGYDSLFIVDNYNKTFAELPASIKNAISHRAKALELMKEELTRRVIR